MKNHTPKNIFVNGPLTPSFIGEKIQAHQSKTGIGAHSIFLGQIRADEKNGHIVEAIEYEAYTDMALMRMYEIREALFQKYSLTCLHVYHSLGRVAASEISLFVFVSSVHRAEAIQACAELVEFIKKDLPVWGRECWKEGHTWKQPFSPGL